MGGSGIGSYVFFATVRVTGLDKTVKQFVKIRHDKSRDRIYYAYKGGGL